MIFDMHLSLVAIIRGACGRLSPAETEIGPCHVIEALAIGGADADLSVGQVSAPFSSELISVLEVAADLAEKNGSLIFPVHVIYAISTSENSGEEPRFDVLLKGQFPKLPPAVEVDSTQTEDKIAEAYRRAQGR